MAIRYICLLVSFCIASCSSSDPTEEQIPPGTFQVDIDGVSWKADFASAISSTFPGDTAEDASPSLTVGGSATGTLELRGRIMTIVILDPQEGTYINDRQANLLFLNPEPDTSLLYVSTSMRLTIRELTEDIVRGSFEASLMEELGGSSTVELTNGVFAMEVSKIEVPDSSGIPMITE